MDLSAVIDQMLMLFFCILIGFIAYKTGVMTLDLQKGLSTLVLSVTMPALILSSVLNRSEESPQVPMLLLVGLGFALILGRLLLSYPLTWLLRVPKEQAGPYRFLTAFSNVGFMGFPVVSALFGPEAVLCAAMFQIPFYLLSYTIGIRQVAGKAERPPLRKTLLHPAVLSSLGALLLYLTDLRLPAVIGQSAAFIGQITTPATMLIVGATLASVPLRQALGVWRLYPYAVITLIAFPLLTYVLLRPFTQSVYILGVTTVLAAMPAATNSTMLCHQYGGDAALCSSGVFVSTVLSLLTIPLLAGWLFAA